MRYLMEGDMVKIVAPFSTESRFRGRLGKIVGITGRGGDPDPIYWVVFPGHASWVPFFKAEILFIATNPSPPALRMAAFPLCEQGAFI
jgi:hypothetical protein